MPAKFGPKIEALPLADPSPTDLPLTRLPINGGFVSQRELASKSHLWFEIAVAFFLLEAFVWTPGIPKVILLLVTFSWIFITGAGGRTAIDIGITLVGLRRSLWMVGIAFAVSNLLLWVAWQTGTLHPAFGPHTPTGYYVAYVVWAIVQQFALQAYFFGRLEILLNSTVKAIMASALLFSFIHLPNPFLMVATLLGGLLFCGIYRKYRNIYSSGLVHAMLGLTLAVTVPGNLHRDMQVGEGWKNYRPPQISTNVTGALALPQPPALALPQPPKIGR